MWSRTQRGAAEAEEVAVLPDPSPNVNPLAPITPASDPAQSEPIESALVELDIPADAGTDGESFHSAGAAQKSDLVEPVDQPADAFHLKADWWPWYAAAIGLLLMLFGGGRSTEALLSAWTVAGIVLIALPLIHVPAALRIRLVGAAAVFFAAVLAAWRFVANPDLGALVLAGNGRAVAALVVLTAILGALTASRRWTVLQSGVWFAALAASGWWLLRISGSQELLAAWRELLPYKQVEHSPKTFVFDTADALLLSILPIGLLAIGASAGLLFRTLVVDGIGAFHLSRIQVIAFAATLCALLIATKTSVESTLTLIVLLAIVWGAIARSLRELVRFSAVVAGAVLAFAARDVASSGLLEWWGPHYCHDFLGYDCTPSQQVPWVIFPLAVLPLIAAVSYGVKRLFGFEEGDLPEV